MGSSGRVHRLALANTTACSPASAAVTSAATPPYPASRFEEDYLPDLDRVLDAVDRCLAH